MERGQQDVLWLKYKVFQPERTEIADNADAADSYSDDSGDER